MTAGIFWPMCTRQTVDLSSLKMSSLYHISTRFWETLQTKLTFKIRLMTITSDQMCIFKNWTKKYHFLIKTRKSWKFKRSRASHLREIVCTKWIMRLNTTSLRVMSRSSIGFFLNFKWYHELSVQFFTCPPPLFQIMNTATIPHNVKNGRENDFYQQIL